MNTIVLITILLLSVIELTFLFVFAIRWVHNVLLRKHEYVMGSLDEIKVNTSETMGDAFQGVYRYSYLDYWDDIVIARDSFDDERYIKENIPVYIKERKRKNKAQIRMFSADTIIHTKKRTYVMAGLVATIIIALLLIYMLFL